MRGLLLAATAAASIAGFAAGCLLTQAGAQPAPPPVAGDPPAPGRPGAPSGWRMGPHPGGPGWHHQAMLHRARTFGLLYHVDDRQLTAPEVQKIAEGFLLWNGNRTWKVTDVAAAPDGKVSFAFATADGSVIARFAMDSKTGRVTRIG